MARNPDDVLASIRQLVAQEVRHAQAREATHLPHRPEMPVLSEKASQAARLVLDAESRISVPSAPRPGETAHGSPEALSAPLAEDGTLAEPAAEDGDLRVIIREVLRQELAAMLDQQIDDLVRKRVAEALATAGNEKS